MTDKEKTINELKETLDSLDITNKYRLNIIRAIEYLQEESVSEELEEAAHKYADIRMSNYETAFYAFMSGANWKKEKDDEEKVLTYKHGFDDCKEQIMAKAIDAEVLENWDGKVIKYDETILDEKLSDCKVFDKVKLIVLKED